nr:MAG TPA: hypothetical protein [Caudoviricetes sp.]
MVKHYPFLCSNVKYLPKIRFFVVNIWIIRKFVVSLHRLNTKCAYGI